MGHFEGYNDITVYVDDEGVKWINSHCTERYIEPEDAKPLSLIGELNVPDQSEVSEPLEVTPKVKMPVRKRAGRPRKKE